MSLGKHLQLNIDEQGRIASSHISTHFIESERVVVQQTSNQNHHIFNQLRYGTSNEVFDCLIII